jgi:chromosome segregation ATPase
MMMMEDYKEEINNSLKEIQENASNQMKEMNKTMQDLKMEVETIKKSQREITLEIENLGKKSGAIEASITNRIQDIEKRISGEEDSIEKIDTTIKESVKCKNILTQNIQEIQDTMRRSNLRITDIEEREDSHPEG